MQNSFLFITGRGRSGTWLLQTILNSHPDICIAPEAIFIINLYSKYHNTTKWNSLKIEQFVHDLFQEQKVGLWWHLDEEELVNYLKNYPKISSFSEICFQVYKHYASKTKPSSKLIGDKNPEHSLFINRIIELYANCKIIHVVRDPRSNVFSYTKVGFDLNNIYALAYRWNHYNKQVLKLLRSYKYDNKVLVLKYEDLVSQPDKVLLEISTFLKIENNFNYTGKESNMNIFSWNKKIKEPLDKTRISAYKDVLTYKEIAGIEYITSSTANQFRYEFTKHKTIHNIKVYWGLLIGHITVILEKSFFFFPFNFRMSILKLYRRHTGVIQ